MRKAEEQVRARRWGGRGTHLAEAAAVTDALGQLLDLSHLVGQPLLLIKLLGQRLQLREGQL